MELRQLLDNPNETPAVLCGSGISFSSGLPTAAGLYDLLGKYAADDFARTLFARHQPGLQQDVADPPYTPIRFEGILDVLQRLQIDPNLTVLDSYRGGKPNPSHHALASLALKVPVVTVNFDGLIEQCMTLRQSGKQVFFTENHFSSSVPTAGLWKIHGTVIDPNGKPVNAHMDGGPVGTLRVISRIRESKSRRAFLSALLKQFAVIVVGYSGSDDFDITRWLRDANNPRQLIWIQYSRTLGHERVTEADLLASSKNNGNYDFDIGLRRLVTSWQRKGQLAKLVVLRSGNPEALLCDLVEMDFPTNKGTNLVSFPLTAGSINEWRKLIVTGTMLTELSYYQTAIGYLRRAAEEASDDQSRVVSFLELSRALLRLGGSENSFNAASEAAQYASNVAVRTDNQDLITRAAIYSKLTQLTTRLLVKAGKMSEAEFDEIEISLKQLFVKCTADTCIENHGSIGFEALVILQRARRFRGKSPDQEIQAGIEKFEKFGLLDAKATVAHDQALRKWKLSINNADLYTAIETLHEAVELRQDLGDVSGASASWNVLGFMYQRLAWLIPKERVAQLKHAEDASRRALALAQRNAIPFAENQAMVGKIVLHLRRSKLSEASDGFAILAVRNFQLDPRTKLEVKFCIILQDAIKPVAKHEICQQLKNAANNFNRLFNDIDKKTDDRFVRIQVCAQINAALCEAWADNSLVNFAKLGTLDSLTPAPIIDRLMVLSKTDPHKAIHERATILLDPLGP